MTNNKQVFTARLHGDYRFRYVLGNDYVSVYHYGHNDQVERLQKGTPEFDEALTVLANLYALRHRGPSQTIVHKTKNNTFTWSADGTLRRYNHTVGREYYLNNTTIHFADVLKAILKKAG